MASSNEIDQSDLDDTKNNRTIVADQTIETKRDEQNGDQRTQLSTVDKTERSPSSSSSSAADEHDSSPSDHDGQSIDQQQQPSSSSTEKLSKRQLRKLKKRQVWEETRVERRKEERRRRSERKRAMMAKGEFVPRKRIKHDPDRRSSCHVKIVIDMSFDHLMNDRDLKKCLNQLQYCYSVNRRATNPLNLTLTSFGPTTKSRRLFDETRGCANWDETCIKLRSDGYRQVYEKEKIVYLTSESTNVLDKLDDEDIYVIGGLIDHNVHKGLCYDTAVKEGLRHARLPIDEYVVMKTRKVLTINHVFEIMLRYTECGDWEKAFFDVLPKRKEAQKKEEATTE